MSKLSNFILVLALALAIYWGYGYELAKRQGETSLLHYIQANIDFNEQRLSTRINGSLGKLDSDIKTDDRLKKGALTELSEAIGIYQAENDRLPTQKQLAQIYRDSRGLLKDADFKYATSSDSKHFQISIKLKDGQEYKLNR